MYTVSTSKKAKKSLEKLPVEVQQIFLVLVVDLENGPHQGGKWKGYSKLPDGSHHCHLNYRFVACWRIESKNSIEVYYVGTREGAPY